MVALLCSSSIPAARAQDASGWKTEAHAAARLIAGEARGTSDGTVLRAGLEIRLDPGWKTYWRYPGDSGVPPTFDFSGSENVKSVAVSWPAPERFEDGSGGHSVGYVDDVILPLRVTAHDSTKPVLLRVKLGYAVCGKFCVPDEAELELRLAGNGGTAEAALAAAEARVPRHVALGSGSSLAVRSVHRAEDAAHKQVVIEVAAPDATPVDLVVEGPTPEWALPLPVPASEPSSHDRGVRRFTFDLDGLPPGAEAAGARLTITAVSPSDAIEVSAHLD